MILTYMLFILGIFLLIKSADYLVEGSSSLANKLGISTLVIGLTIVAFGTSMPELFVNVIASIQGKGDIAFGNIIGSNMANILLILGVSAIITKITVQRSTVWKEIPFSFLAALVLFVFVGKVVLDGIYNEYILLRTEGIILILFFVIFIYYVFELSKKNKGQNLEVEIKKHSNWIIFLMIFGGIIGLYLGGKWTVDGAVEIARQFGLSELLISSTIIAIGTSLPELVTSISAARKKDMDMAVGNVVGSNIFNIFWVLGVTAIISPLALPAWAIVDISLVLIATFLLFAFLFLGERHKLGRIEGTIFLILYLVYLIFLIFRG